MTTETNKTAGDDIDSNCLKCKAVTNHTIIAIADDIIAKVECNTCRARHKYRAPKVEKKKASSTRLKRDGAVIKSGAKAKKTTTTAAAKKLLRGAVNFDALIDGKDVSAAIPYALDALLTGGDLIEHKVFGLGVVMATMLPNKVEVNFREHGTKLMVCTLG